MTDVARDVIVKQSYMETGIGSLDASPLWESEPTEEGAIVRLDQAVDHRLFVTFTDAEEFDGAYVSVEVSKQDIDRLWHTIVGLTSTGRW
jgi:hypothetical protein